MYTVQFLNRLVENHLVLTYILIFFVTIFEGEIVAIASGILILLGALNFWLALIAVFLGGMIKTVLWYFFGKFLHKKFNDHRFFKYIEKRVLNVMPHFEQKPFWSIFISKFLMVNHLVILFSGYKNINFRKYLEAEFASTLFWAPGLILLGYFFSFTAIKVSHQLWHFALIVLVLIISFIVLDKLVRWLYDFFEEFYDNGK